MSKSEKSSLYQELNQALLFLPRSFIKKGQTLDSAFDGYRLHKTLSASSLDLILMSYRYAHWFEKVATKFSAKKIKPVEMLDLWLGGFTALLTRDKVPAFAIVSECVEIAKIKFGPHTAGITNAFLRHIVREKAKLQAELSATPTLIFPPWLVTRWQDQPGLATMAKHFARRPAAGVWGFDQKLEHLKAEWSEHMFAHDLFQAMDTGSYDFCRWMSAKLGENDRSFIDACAAPGGKAIFAAQRLRNLGIPADFVLCEAKQSRMAMLKENLTRWGFDFNPANLRLHEWGRDPLPNELSDRSWDFVMCDLPCSGSGTLFTRPDILFRDWQKNIDDLKSKQNAILTDVLKLATPKIFISICSTDPEEIANVSAAVGASPTFKSWDDITSDAPREGIVGWYCERALRPLQ